MPEREREFRRTWIWRDPPGHRTCRFGQTWEGLWSPTRVWRESTGGFLWGLQAELTDAGNDPLDAAWREVRLAKRGRREASSEAPEIIQGGVMATYTRVVGVEVMRSLWDIFSRQSEKDVLMAWKSDVRKRQASKTVLVLGQSNCADGGAVYWDGEHQRREGLEGNWRVL